MALWKGVDSFSAPSDAQLALAKADGCLCWNGYLPGKGIDSTWTSADFARIKDAGLHTLAYASGNADPEAMKQLAAQWGVTGCLDVEDGIRGDGPWVQPWLDASGFGVYHEEYNDPPYTAPFHIVADYVATDPRSSWPLGMTPPSTPKGWQWKANCVAYGAHVDKCYFDSEIFVTDPKPTPPVEGKEVLLLVTVADNPNTGMWLFGNGNYSGVASGPDETALRAAGAIDITVSDAQHERWRAAYPAGTFPAKENA